MIYRVDITLINYQSYGHFWLFGFGSLVKKFWLSGFYLFGCPDSALWTHLNWDTFVPSLAVFNESTWQHWSSRADWQINKPKLWNFKFFSSILNSSNVLTSKDLFSRWINEVEDRDLVSSNFRFKGWLHWKIAWTGQVDISFSWHQSWHKPAAFIDYEFFGG